MNLTKRLLKAEKIPLHPGVTLYERVGGRPGVSTLIKWFYAKVRFDPLLEPIFNAHIRLWGKHLELLIDFWAEKMGGPPLYNGNLERHSFLGLGPEHFAAWLAVWEENCRWLLNEPEAGEMIGLGQRLARELQEMGDH
ncbi:MAG: group III truncated hemoglobin [Verrucomicrobiota bacterium]